MGQGTSHQVTCQDVLSLDMSRSPFLTALGQEVSQGAGIKWISKANLSAVLAEKEAFARIDFICVISSAINSTWQEEKSGKFHSNHE